MIRLLLTAALALSLQDDVVALQHATELEMTLGPGDPVLEGVGPSKTFHYQCTSEDSVLFLWARSESIDLVLRIETETGERLEDDDSGGLSSPFLRAERPEGRQLIIRVAAKKVTEDSPITVQCFEAPETETTRTVAQQAAEAIQDVQRIQASGDLEGARALVSETLDQITAMEGFEDSAAISQVFFDLGVAAYQLNDIPVTARAWRHSLAFDERTLPDEHPDLQTSRGNTAIMMEAMGDAESAKVQLEKVLDVFSRMLPEDHDRVQVVRGNLAVTLSTLGDLAGAIELEEQVVASMERTLPEGHPDRLLAQGNLGLTLMKAGKVRRARKILEAVLEARSKTAARDDLDLQYARLDVAAVLYEEGELERARDLLDSALQILTRILPEGHDQLRSARQALGAVLFAHGDLTGARTLFERVLESASRHLPEDHPGVQIARQNLAGVLKNQGDLAAARELEERVLEWRSRAFPPDHPDLQKARLNLAGTLSSLGRYTESRQLLETVVEVLSRTHAEDHPDIQRPRMLLVELLLMAGEVSEARDLVSRVAEARSRSLPEEHPDLQRSRWLLAEVLARQGELARAEELLQSVKNSLTQSMASESPDIEDVRISTAWVRARSGRVEEGRQVVHELTREATQRLARFAFTSPREIDAHLGELRETVDAVLSLTSETAEVSEDALGSRLAFSLIEGMRGATTRVHRQGNTTVDDPGLAALRERLIAANSEVSRLASGGEDAASFASAVRDRDRLERELREAFEDSGIALPLAPDLDPDAIASALDEHQAAIGYWRYWRSHFDPETHEVSDPVASYQAWVIRPNLGLKRFELGAAEPIEQAIESWRAAIGAPLGGRGAPASELAGRLGRVVTRLLWTPLQKALGDSTDLVVAPAEAVNLVPFEALPVSDGELVGDRYGVSYRRALSDCTLEEQAAISPHGLLVLGGVDYAGGVESPEERASSASSGASINTLRSGRGGSFRWSFPELTETRDEAASIVQLFRDTFDTAAKDPILLSGRGATRRAFEELAPRHRVLHLATHGWFAPQSVPALTDDRPIDGKSGLGTFTSLREHVQGLAPSLLCGLAFAGANGEADMYGRVRGVMTAEEISTMDLSGVELCVLSACETNVGLRRGGQGIASLQTALHAAGVRTAITSLWKVPDDATRELMTEFYRRLWVLKEPMAKALWSAKQKIRTQLNDEGKPVYSIRDWAGWVLSGDPE
ncbi:MAG: CHAT domain-containing tetratricopeptide repeat protein [Planctomycetota bacterium]